MQMSSSFWNHISETNSPASRPYFTGQGSQCLHLPRLDSASRGELEWLVASCRACPFSECQAVSKEQYKAWAASFSLICLEWSTVISPHVLKGSKMFRKINCWCAVKQKNNVIVLGPAWWRSWLPSILKIFQQQNGENMLGSEQLRFQGWLRSVIRYFGVKRDGCGVPSLQLAQNRILEVCELQPYHHSIKLRCEGWSRSNSGSARQHCSSKLYIIL